MRVRNPDPGRGLSSSLALGLQAIPESDHVIVLLGDQPLILRIVYRLLFTFVAEDRGLLLDPHADIQARERYRDYFSTARLRRTARRRRGTRHADQWRALNLVWDGLGSIDGRPELEIRAATPEDGPSRTIARLPASRVPSAKSGASSRGAAMGASSESPVTTIP